MQKMNSSLVRIAELLSDHKYHDGTSIGNKLDITRAAVWKAVKKIENYGIEIESVKGKGYLLKEPVIFLNEKKIQSGLRQYPSQIEILEKVDSTNDYIKNYIGQDKKVRVCIAETQTHGKGRLNRQWYSPFGKNIHLSFFYPLQKDISELSGLSLMVGLAVCRSIEHVCQLEEQLKIKWPNDIVINRRKIAGILIEIQAESNGFCNAVIGVGANVNIREASNKQISQKWISLQKLTGQHQDRNAICAEMINCILEYLERFIQFGLEDFIDEWKDRDCLFEQSVKVMSSGTEFSGVGAGINSHGHLLLRMPNNTVKSFSSGDTTLVK